MVKGCQKKIVVLKGTNSSVFDEAYFIMKETQNTLESEDMIKEAQRIIDANTLSASKQKKSVKSLIWYLAGLVTGCIVFGVVFAFI